MKIRSVRTKLYQRKGPVKTTDTIFAAPVSLFPFQNDAQAPYRFFSWLVVEIETDNLGGYLCGNNLLVFRKILQITVHSIAQ